LKEIKLNDGLETIEESAFYSCKKLKGLEKPSTLKSTWEDAFN
jgi:hypothetical protein